MPDRESIKRQIRDAVDIADLIGSYVSLRRAGNAFKGLCPFHEEKTPSFTVSPTRNTFKCFGCGAGGDAFTFIQLKENVDFPEALRLLAERAGIEVDAPQNRGSDGPGKQELVRVNDWALRLFRQQYESAQGQVARDYVVRRGISPEMVELFGLGFAPDSYNTLVNKAQQSGIAPVLLDASGLVKRGDRGPYDAFRNRLMFPIHDPSGRVIGFGGRTLGDDPAKYLNSPATALFDKSTSLFGLNHARHGISAKGRVIVVEGYTDCIMAHQFGFTETVATLGTAMTEAHASMLRRYTDQVVLLFDSDEAGQKAADRAISVTLTTGLDVSLAKVPQGKDPCDFLLMAGAEALESVLKAGCRALEFKWNLVAGHYQASATGPERRRALEDYLKQLAAWLGRGAIDPIQKGLLVNQLSKVLSLPPEEVYRQLDHLARRPNRSEGHAGVARAGSGLGADTSVVGAEQRALRQVVEVLVNDPSFFARVEAHFEPGAIRDRQLAAVAVELAAMLRSGEPFELNDLMDRFESPEYARLITDLQSEGEERGKFAEIIEGAIPCLESCQRAREAMRLADEIRKSRQPSQTPGTTGLVPEGEDERLAALAAAARPPQFSPVRARKRFL